MDDFVFVVLAIVVLITLFMYSQLSESKNKLAQKTEELEKLKNSLAGSLLLKDNELLLKEKTFESTTHKLTSDILVKEKEYQAAAHKWALDEFEKFKKTEVESILKTAQESANNSAKYLLQKWILENEARIRQDAINRSYTVNLGKITEHLLPFHFNFPFNPKDVRFIGAPIDLIVFDGLADQKAEVSLYFIEVKTGKSKLTESQNKIKKAIENGKVIWKEINPDIDDVSNLTNKLTLFS